MTYLKKIAVRTLVATTREDDAVSDPPLKAIIAAVALGLLASTLLG